MSIVDMPSQAKPSAGIHVGQQFQAKVMLGLLQKFYLLPLPSLF
jgi:hypothetical protein